MTRFCAIYTGRPLRRTMKFTSFPISDDWLIKMVTCIIALFAKSATFVRCYSEQSACCESVECECKEGFPLGYSYSIIAAIVAVISCMSVALSLPRLLIKRSTSTPRICIASMAESFVKPLESSGSMRTYQIFPAKWSFQLVIGTTNLIDRCLMPSELMTTAGRIFWISAPTVGLKFRSQTSPRHGLGGFVFDKVSPFKFTPFRIILVVINHPLRLFSQQAASRIRW